MVGYDRNGRGSTTNYLYGGGPVKYAPLNSNNMPSGGWQEFGCVSDLQINLDSQTQDHFCARTGTNVRDLQIVTQVGASLVMTVDEFKFESAALWSVGSETKKTRPAIAALPATATILVPNPAYTGTAIENNRAFAKSYDIHSNGTLIEGGVFIDGSSAFAYTTQNRIPSTSDNNFALTSIVAINGVAPTGTYTVNTTAGITYLPQTAEFYIAGEDFLDSTFEAEFLAKATTGAANPFVELEITITGTSGAMAAAKDYDGVSALTGTSKAVAMRYEGFNTESGQRVIVEIPRVKLLPQGGIALINTQNVGNLPFNGSIESNLAYTSQNGGYFLITAID
jgi:hypothetical protein